MTQFLRRWLTRKKSLKISEKGEKRSKKSTSKLIIDSILYFLGCVLIFGGLAILIWVLRPYLVLLFCPSQRAALERKVHSNAKDNRIIIPSVLVDAPIVEGITSKALTQGVGHISGTAYPGEEGNCILEGHNLAEFGLWGKQSFFSLLDVLRKGAKVYVFYNGKKYVYKVEEKKKLEISNPKLYRDTHREQLTLITCVSTWSPTIYTKWRTVIICKPVKR